MKRLIEWMASHVFLFGVLMFTVLLDFLTRAIDHFKDGEWLRALALLFLFYIVAKLWIFKWSKQIK